MGDMRNYGRSPMDLRDTAEIDRESQFDQRPLRKAEIRRLDEHAVGAQIPGTAELPFSTRHGHVYGGASPMPRVKTPFHRETPATALLVSHSDSEAQYAAGKAAK
jgi:hypothetical protein